MNARCSQSRLGRPRGGAYIATLLALAVLTALGLSVLQSTQIETRIGANERTVQRALFAADAGLAAATARALGSGDYASAVLTLADLDSPPGLGLRHVVESSAFYPIHDSSCDLCDVDAAGSYSESVYRRYRFAITATARRGHDSSTASIARKTVTTLLDVQPWAVPTDAYRPLAHPDELKKIRF